MCANDNVALQSIDSLLGTRYCSEYFCVLSHWALTTIYDAGNYCPYFIDEKIEVKNYCFYCWIADLLLEVMHLRAFGLS